MNINNIYEYLIDNDEITTKKLNDFGYNARSINDLMENKIIERVKKGYYQICNLNGLYKYGKNLLDQRERTRAIECFARCYKINPNHAKTCFQLFICSIADGKYDEAIKYLDAFYEKSDKQQQRDYDLYLLLLSNITTLPDKHQQYIRFLKYDDIKIEDNNKVYTDKKSQNKMRLSVLDHKFTFAFHQIIALKNQNSKAKCQNFIIGNLLYEVVQIEKSNRNKIMNYIKEKDYQKIIDLLSAKNTLHSLSLIDEYSLKLAKINLEISMGNRVRFDCFEEATSVFVAIDRCNYELALKLDNSYNLTNNINGSDNILHLLLGQTVELINSKKNNKAPSETSPLETVTESHDPVKDDYNKEKEYIQIEANKLIASKGLVMLEPMIESRMAIIHEIVSSMPNIVSFNIGVQPQVKVVLKYIGIPKNAINYIDIMSEIDYYYSKCQYDTCIYELERFISICGEVNPYHLYRLGGAYYKIGNKEKAFEYLDKAQKMCKRKKLLGLINELRLKIEAEVPNIEEIRSLVFHNGISIEEACRTLNIDPENIYLVKLNIAKDLYIYGMYDEADKLVRQADRCDEKTPAFMDLREKIRTRKTFYRYREYDPESFPTTLKLHPRRK